MRKWRKPCPVCLKRGRNRRKKTFVSRALSAYFGAGHYPRMSRTAFVVWAALVYMLADNNGFGEVSRGELMKLTGIGSRDTVRRELEHLHRVDRPLTDQERDRRNFYQVKHGASVSRERDFQA